MVAGLIRAGPSERRWSLRTPLGYIGPIGAVGRWRAANHEGRGAALGRRARARRPGGHRRVHSAALHRPGHHRRERLPTAPGRYRRGVGPRDWLQPRRLGARLPRPSLRRPRQRSTGRPCRGGPGALEAEGWQLSDDVGFHRWATFSGRHTHTTVAVGAAAVLAGWDYAGDPSTVVARQLDGTGGTPSAAPDELPRAVAMRFDLVGDWDYC